MTPAKMTTTTAGSKSGGRFLLWTLEQAQQAGWPSLCDVWLDGWLVRRSLGPTGRSNSINALAPGTQSLPARLAEAVALYRAAGLRPTARLTPLTEPGLDPLLGQLGWERYNETLVMTAGLAGARRDTGVEITRTPDPLWIEALTLTGASPARMAEHRRLLPGMIVPALYARIGPPEAPQAIGMATVALGQVMLFEIATDPAHRRRGLADRLCRALLAEGAALGARAALLQVVVDNAAAQALYRPMGFDLAYGYWYRRAPV